MGTKALSKILNSSEIKVYFALLEIGQSTVGPIIKAAKVPDSKIYSILEKLKEKGLASFVIKNNVRHFQASDPRNMIKILDEKKAEIEKERNEIEKIIPQIEMRRKMSEDVQEATVYESYNGVKAAFSVILVTLGYGEEYQVFMLGEALREKRVVQFFKNYHKQRIEKGIRVRLIGQDTLCDVINKHHRYRGMKIRFTDLKLPLGIFIFKNHIMTVVWEDNPTAFLIKSKKNYEHYKEFFEEVWEMAKV